MCTWKCKQSECPKPKCELKCSGLGKCPLPLPEGNATARLEQKGLKVVATKNAELDPKVLEKPLETPPPLWNPDAPKPGPSPAPAPVATTTQPPTTTTNPAVGNLLSQWAQEDEEAGDARAGPEGHQDFFGIR
jgi:hypothetical protein